MEEINRREFGKRVREIRLKNGMNQEDLGKRMEDISKGENPANKAVVSAWERGISIPNAHRLKIIADLGGITVNELLYGTPEQYFFYLLVSLATNKYDSAISPKRTFEIKKILEDQGLGNIYSYTIDSLHQQFYDFFNEEFKQDKIVEEEGFKKYATGVLFIAFNKIRSAFESLNENDKKENYTFFKQLGLLLMDVLNEANENKKSQNK